MAAKLLSVKKTATGYATLADWNLQLKEDSDVQKVLQDLPIKHLNEKINLLQQHKESFQKWFWHLKQGFSLLFYGFGSKKSLLESFAESACQDGGVLAVNGLAAGVTVRQILIKVSKELRLPVGRAADTANILKAIQNLPRENPFYLFIFNIEGPGLLQLGAQAILSELAACPCIHLVASMDHINTPLLWEKQVAAQFNWLYYDITTYEHYKREVLHLSSILTNQMEERIMRGAATVLKTLVPNARQIFKVLGEAQLEDDEEYEGLEFSHLYRLCRERFLVGNEMALRSHLTEFSDHQMIATKRSRDGGDVIYIPMDADGLRQILEQC